MKYRRESFGTIDGQTIWQYWLENSQGYQLAVTEYGATITHLIMPDKAGKMANVVIGYDHLGDFVKQQAYFGATVGRVAGRIAHGTFELNGHKYQAPINNGLNTNHGGPHSFESQIWHSAVVEKNDAISIVFTLTSPDGENGFPGNLAVTTTYTLNEANEWLVDYQAITDKTTLFNPTCHVYLNLTGDFDQLVGKHTLQIDSDRFGAIQPDGLPTGELVPVTGSVFDLRQPQPLQAAFDSSAEQNTLVNGFDHPFLLNQTQNTADAILRDPESGRSITINTQGNAIVVYTANGFGDEPNLTDKAIQPHQAVAIEAQMMPDAIHHAGFGNIVLQPGEQYHRQTRYQLN
ncbi:aldose epimerase family protein [Latilactobacillus graminis]|uniref:Maltose epimerase n=2 Tax=Latilactobacillus graminis TaxID=60519 RepID=A0AA89I1M6_9LACO|nr:aldose epimerase family protein [Latilactobacillus graminis]KRM23893.1 aldose 1-epimerase family protein [Latilactobacillus graminis DSM 20719]QFP79782.1 galactose mutarotase [Latilactobacillus graminis]